MAEKEKPAFILAGQKNGHYIVYDKINKGYACCTMYTIKQLLERGYEIKGAFFTDTGYSKFTYSRIDGNVDLVEDALRSAATFEKGIKPNKAMREAAKAVKEKTAAAKKAKPDKLKIREHAYRKTKLLALLTYVDEKASEYSSSSEETFTVYAGTPSAFATLKKLVKRYGECCLGGHNSFSFTTIKELADRMKRYGYVKTEITIDGDFSDLDVQVAVGRIVKYSYENHYEDYSFDVTYSYSNKYQPKVTDTRHCSNDENLGFGSTADGGGSVDGFGQWLREKGVVCRNGYPFFGD